MSQSARRAGAASRITDAILISVSSIGLSLPAAAADQDLVDRGEAVFKQEAQPSCTVCHTLKAAGASGQVGPNLDGLKPSEEQVRAAVTSGVGVMPPYRDLLDEDQIAAVAAYVSTVAGSTGE